jgi:hypothetical protein
MQDQIRWQLGKDIRNVCHRERFYQSVHCMSTVSKSAYLSDTDDHLVQDQPVGLPLEHCRCCFCYDRHCQHHRQSQPFSYTIKTYLSRKANR